VVSCSGTRGKSVRAIETGQAGICVPVPAPFAAEPIVRIHLPPVESQQQTVRCLQPRLVGGEPGRAATSKMPRPETRTASPGSLTRASTADRLFIGWFGPRRLATIVFAVLAIHERLSGNATIIVAAGWTVLLSVVAHGVTANPLVKKMAVRSAELAA
jgi:hypothetical protein